MLYQYQMRIICVQHSERLFVHDLYTDLRDGLALLNALEVLSGAKLPREKARNMQRVHHLTNVRTALRFLEERKVCSRRPAHTSRASRASTTLYSYVRADQAGEHQRDGRGGREAGDRARARVDGDPLLAHRVRGAAAPELAAVLGRRQGRPARQVQGQPAQGAPRLGRRHAHQVRPAHWPSPPTSRAAIV